ncbi:major Facilitator Superfamily Transporter 17 [Musca autumnalis]|uniref:major Facilitator Superfamily Transporter 17 n=1 Tax=Musca autumnalis TaxID=221902 RepID=UPI003CF90644
MYNSSYNSLKQVSSSDVANGKSSATATSTTSKSPPVNPTRNPFCFNTILHKLNAKVPARLVLYMLSWSGFLVSFMMRNDMHLAIVAMTPPGNNTVSNGGRCADTILPNSSATFTSVNTTTLAAATTTTAHNISVIPAAEAFIATSAEQGHQPQYYNWSGSIQSVINSSFFWCYVLSQVFGGIATQKFGTKKVFGWSQFATALCSLLMPAGADIHYGVLIALRSIQGCASGLTWPAMYAVVGYWIPLIERSRFMSSFQGFSIGTGLTFVLGGFITKRFGWQYVFYTTGSLGMLWCVFWYLLAYNTPQEHPRITKDELEYIEINISSEMKKSLGKKVPWKDIITSKPALAIAITTFGRIWVHYVFIINGPNFMKNILCFDYEANGVLSGMPHICSYISSVIFCYIADKLLHRHCMTLTNIRKLFTALSQVVPGVLILFIGYIDNIVLLLVIWFITVSFITASYAGAMANIVDIAPNFAGPVLAFCQTIHMSASFLSPLISGMILQTDTAIDEWRTVFIVAAIVTNGTYVMYQIYGTAEIQKWDSINSVGGGGDVNGAGPSSAANGDIVTCESGGKQSNCANNDDDDDDDDVEESKEDNQMLKKTTNA